MLSAAALDAARAEVEFAYDNVPFFRRHMERAGLRPGDIQTAGDFRKIPPTRKADYRKNFPAGVLAKGKSLSGRFVFRSTSSGTSGERLSTVAHTYTLAQRMSRTMSAHPPFARAFEASPKRRAIRYAAPNCSDVECATPQSTVADRTLADGTLVLPVHHDLLATPEPMVAQSVDELLAYAPDWLYVDPTHLAFLIRHMRRRGVSPPPVFAIALTYTQCTRVARRQIEAFFAPEPPIADVLSMSEFGWLAIECPRRTHHVNTTSFYVELMVGERPAEPGELAELVLTSLGDKLSPHIRYHTGDYYRACAAPCPCGHDHLAVIPEGRRTDFLIRAGQVALTPRGVDDLVGEAPWIDLYKIEQLSGDDFAFRYIASDSFEPEREGELVDRLREALGDGARVRVERARYISGDRSGKFVCCKSAVRAEPAALAEPATLRERR